MGGQTEDVADAPRRKLVERMRARLEAGYWPRVHCMLIVTLATAVACLTSFLLLVMRVHSMAIRYGAAALAGYGTFLFLLHAWVRWKWSRFKPSADGNDLVDAVTNAIDVPIDLSSLPDAPLRFAGGGGRSGGGGASGAWDSGPKPSPGRVGDGGGGGKGGGPSTGSGHGWSLDLDGDDLFWLIVALVAAFAGVAAVGYVIWIAPTLLAEAIVNGAVAGKVYHGLRKREDDFWTSQILRRTIVSGLVVILCAIAAGYAFNRIAPEARSIGGVWAHLEAKYSGS
jgi:hypothetical protein